MPKYKVDALTSVVNKLTHLSSKPVNSNAPLVGVRIAGDDKQSLPYISVSTVGPDNVPTDANGAGTIAGHFKLIRLARTDPAQLNKKETEFAEEHADWLAEALRALNTAEPAALIGTDVLNVRMPQMLWPVGGGEYHSLSPLHSTGLSLVVNETVRGLNETLALEYAERKTTEHEANTRAGVALSKQNRAKKLTEYKRLAPYYRRLSIDVGGSNKANAGCYAHQVCSLLRFQLPTEDSTDKVAFSYAYKGLPFNVAYRSIEGYAQWRATLPLSKLNTVRSREKGEKLIKSIAREYLRKAQEAAELLSKRSLEPSSQLSALQKTLLSGEAIDAGVFARELSRYIALHKTRIDGAKEKVTIGLGDDELAAMISYIEEVAL